MRKLLFDVFVVLCIVSVFVGVILNIFIVDYDADAAFLLSCYFGLPSGILYYGLLITKLYPMYSETKLVLKVIGLLFLSGSIPLFAFGGFMGWLVFFNGCSSRGVIERKVDIVKEVGGPDDDRKHFVNFKDGSTSYSFVVSRSRYKKVREGRAQVRMIEGWAGIYRLDRILVPETK